MNILKSMLIVLTTLFSQILNATIITYTLGVDDHFSTANGAELASPSAGCSVNIQNNPGQTIGNFDRTDQVNRTICNLFSFSEHAGNIVGAELTFRIRSNGSNSSNDTISLERNGDINDRWSSLITAPALANSNWVLGTQYAATLDLSALPTNTTPINLISSLNTYGFIEFRVQDDTALDFVTLSLNVVPVPSAFYLFGLGLVGIGWKKRK